MDLVGELSRRRLLQGASYGVAVSGLALLAAPSPVIAGSVQETAEAVVERASAPKLSIIVPKNARRLDSVPVTVSIDGEAQSVETIFVLAEGSSTPELARFAPIAAGPTIEVSADVRIGRAQRLWAVARMEDGRIFMATADIVG